MGFTDDMVNFWCHAVRWFHYHGDESLEAMPTLTAIEAFYQAFNEALKKEEESFFGRKLLFKSGAEALTIWLIGDDDFTMEGAGTSIVDLTSSDKRRVLFKFEPQHLVNKSSNISEHVISHAMLHDPRRPAQEYLSSSTHVPLGEGFLPRLSARFHLDELLLSFHSYAMRFHTMRTSFQEKK